MSAIGRSERAQGWGSQQPPGEGKEAAPVPPVPPALSPVPAAPGGSKGFALTGTAGGPGLATPR